GADRHPPDVDPGLEYLRQPGAQPGTGSVRGRRGADAALGVLGGAHRGSRHRSPDLPLARRIGHFSPLLGCVRKALKLRFNWRPPSLRRPFFLKCDFSAAEKSLFFLDFYEAVCDWGVGSGAGATISTIACLSLFEPPFLYLPACGTAIPLRSRRLEAAPRNTLWVVLPAMRARSRP